MELGTPLFVDSCWCLIERNINILVMLICSPPLETFWLFSQYCESEEYQWFCLVMFTAKNCSPWKLKSRIHWNILIVVTAEWKPEVNKLNVGNISSDNMLAILMTDFRKGIMFHGSYQLSFFFFFSPLHRWICPLFSCLFINLTLTTCSLHSYFSAITSKHLILLQGTISTSPSSGNDNKLLGASLFEKGWSGGMISWPVVHYIIHPLVRASVLLGNSVEFFGSYCVLGERP